MKIAIQGDPGSNSHLAALQLLGTADLLPCALSVEVFERIAISKEAVAAVLPIENSLHGAVADHSDLLLEYGVLILAEVSLRIRHALIAVPGVCLADVKQVLSHPVALSQCRRFFRGRPQLEAVPFYDTAGAVKHLVASHREDAAAIASPYAAEVYEAAILQRDLEDDPQNFTRFLLLAAPQNRDRLTAGTAEPVNKMTIAINRYNPYN